MVCREWTSSNPASVIRRSSSGLAKRWFQLVEYVAGLGEDRVLHVGEASRLDRCRALGHQAGPRGGDLEVLADNLPSDRPAGGRDGGGVEEVRVPLAVHHPRCGLLIEPARVRCREARVVWRDDAVDTAAPRIVRGLAAGEENRDGLGLTVVSVHGGIDEVGPHEEAVGDVRRVLRRSHREREHGLDAQCSMSERKTDRVAQ
jgi:hypothetical protein